MENFIFCAVLHKQTLSIIQKFAFSISNCACNSTYLFRVEETERKGISHLFGI